MRDDTRVKMMGLVTCEKEFIVEIHLETWKFNPCILNIERYNNQLHSHDHTIYIYI